MAHAVTGARIAPDAAGALVLAQQAPASRHAHAVPGAGAPGVACAAPNGAGGADAGAVVVVDLGETVHAALRRILPEPELGGRVAVAFACAGVPVVACPVALAWIAGAARALVLAGHAPVARVAGAQPAAKRTVVAHAVAVADVGGSAGAHMLTGSVVEPVVARAVAVAIEIVVTDAVCGADRGRRHTRIEGWASFVARHTPIPEIAGASSAAITGTMARAHTSLFPTARALVLTVHATEAVTAVAAAVPCRAVEAVAVAIADRAIPLQERARVLAGEAPPVLGAVEAAAVAHTSVIASPVATAGVLMTTVALTGAAGTIIARETRALAISAHALAAGPVHAGLTAACATRAPVAACAVRATS
mmetsp:Transcript_7924/g.15359  ORF Transcript_7924/g.15359 Transcript_7924/m.15359 type:complete len:363 (+) Transcript_7924:294-1382(+)